jgi:2-oxoisovalerate dehydrogenase E1 component
MPKSIVLEPEKLLAEGRIHFADIEVNAYHKTIEEERAVLAPQDFLAIWQDMSAIREFEIILNEIKTRRTYKGIAYDHMGPAHLSIGQEAAAVGMAFLLAPDDHIYGSHRSHGEILAKGFSAIRKTEDHALLELMRTYLDGAILRPLEKEHRGSVKDLAVKFLIFGAYSELFAKETGLNRGLGGSPFSHPSAFFRTTPLWADQVRSHPARRFSRE